ncbi:MAG: tetratricopeptide repeat protein [Spirochaetales bacterium]|nr:tetratricopeptide repeat protein [Spirochaetales bacterium]
MSTKTLNYKELLNEAKTAGQNRDYEKAVELLTELISKTDEMPEALLYLGRSYHALEQFHKAIYSFNFFLKIKPDFSPAHFFLGRSYLALGFYKNAIIHLRKALNDNETFSPALSFIGLAYLKIKRPEIALSYFEKALEVDPQNPRIYTGYLNALLVQAIKYFYRGRLDEAAQRFEFLIKEKKDNIIPYLYLASIYREAGQFKLALISYEEALKISPADPVLHLQKAYILLHLSKSPQALMEIKKAQELLQDKIGAITDPLKLLKLISVTYYRNKHYRETIYFGKKVLKHDYHDPDIHMLIAESYRYLGEAEKAKNHYLRAIEVDPKRLELHYGLALIFWEQQAYQELSSQSARILRINPDDPMAAYFQALSLAYLKTDPKTVIPLLQQQIRAHGPDPHLMYCLGKMYFEIDLPDLAENWLKRILTLVQDHQESFLLLAAVYRKLAKPKQEIQVLKQYVVIFTDDISTRKRYVRLLLQEDKYSIAAGEIVKLITREAGNLKLKRALAYCYQKLQKYADAILIFKELLKQDPESVDDLRALLFCLDKMGNRRSAILLLESALKFLKETPELLLTLGKLYAKQKDYEKASRVFRRVIDSRPEDWQGYYNLGMIYKKTGNTEFADKFLKRAEEYR